MLERYTTLLCLLLLTACTPEGSGHWDGWLEAETIAVAGSGAGNITHIYVQRGDQVRAGQALYVLDAVAENAAVAEAQAGLHNAQSRRANLAYGKRPPELAAIDAQLQQARDAMALSLADLQRQQTLQAQHFIAVQSVDEARTHYQQDQQHVRELQAQLSTARLRGRPDELHAADADIAAALALLQQAQWKLDQKSIKAPAAGLIDDVLYREGEWLGSGVPALLLLPPDHMKARFFINEADLGHLRIGQTLQLQCDGCPQPLPAKLSYIAAQPEYTPPLIYSRENRADQIYRAEAWISPAQAFKLHPGQPVEVIRP